MDGWTKVRDDIAIDNEEYQLTFEVFENGQGQQMVFVHFYIWKDWSLKLLKRIQREWAVIRKHVTCPLYCSADAEDEKWTKFVTLFGWKPLIEDAECSDGRKRRIYIHHGSQGNGTVKNRNNLSRH